MIIVSIYNIASTTIPVRPSVRPSASQPVFVTYKKKATKPNLPKKQYVKKYVKKSRRIPKAATDGPDSNTCWQACQCPWVGLARPSPVRVALGI